MADKGFNIQHYLALHEALLIAPPMMRNKNVSARASTAKRRNSVFLQIFFEFCNIHGVEVAFFFSDILNHVFFGFQKLKTEGKYYLEARI